MKQAAALIVILFSTALLGSGSAAADAFERYGLRPAALIVPGADEATFERTLQRAGELGARGLLAMPPTLVFARFPAGTGAADFANLGIFFAAEAHEIDPFSTDLVTLRSARALLESGRILRESPAPPVEPFESMLLRVPPELIERTKVPGPRQGAPSQILERAIDQNSEFMIGSVLINVVLPENPGGSEAWTDQEIAALLTDINLGLNQYVQQTHWVDLSFIVNCPPQHRRVPVSITPIEGDWNTDWRWITDAMRALGVDHTQYPGSLLMTHAYNNQTRVERGADWVFTAYIADASDSPNNCWQGPSGGYAAYAYLGGPYIVVPYPACRFGVEIGFAHVFIHEMSHIFWALDEYASAGQSCNATSGYLAYRNGNSYYGGFTGIPCGEGLPCIMNNAPLSAPLPICRYTMGQVGLADDNNNSIPDLYEIHPQIEFQTLARGDTTYDGIFPVSCRFWNEALPNRNPYQDPGRRVSYAPGLVAGWMRINGGFWNAFNPNGGAWGGSEADLGVIMQGGVEPGDNWIHIRVRNRVGLEARDSMRVVFIGIKFYENTASVEPGAIRLSWRTASQVFDAVFDVCREDLTNGGPELVLATISGDEPAEEGATRKVFRYVDDTVEAGHRYRYRIVGRMQGREYSSREIVRIATIPFAGNLLSPLAPNPLDQGGTRFSIRVPKSYHDPSGALPADSRGMQYAPALREVKTQVQVDVYDVTGRKVRGIFSLPIFGGEDLTLEWDGLDDGGKPVAAGVYFIRVTAGSMQEVRKAVILR